jgi:hypothetical protein
VRLWQAFLVAWVAGSVGLVVGAWVMFVRCDQDSDDYGCCDDPGGPCCDGYEYTGRQPTPADWGRLRNERWES